MTFKKRNHSPLKNRQSPLTNPSLDGVSRIDEGAFKLSDKIYNIKNKDRLILTGKQLREWKGLIIKDYQRTEYQKRVRTKAIREGFLEGIDTIKQWIINEQNLDPEPCCHGVRIENIINKIEDLKKQGDKRFVLDEKHLSFIRQMLEEGYSKNQIAKELQVSVATIVYWTNSKYRKRQMEKNAKRKFGKKLVPIVLAGSIGGGD